MIPEIVNILMFNWETIDINTFNKYCEQLSPKLLRWLGAHHPDNKTRRSFFERTNIKIGEGTVINSNFIVSDDYEPLLIIGSNVAISPNVTVVCASAPNNSALANNEYVKQNLVCKKPVIIEDNAWVGANSIILPGVVLGKGCIIGAGSVVTRSVEPDSIVAGNPAKLIRRL